MCSSDLDLPTAQIAVASSPVLEDGGGYMTYTVTLSNQSAFATTAVISLVGSATSGTDYVVKDSGGNPITVSDGQFTLTIAAGATTASFRVYPTSDTLYEGDETVTATAVVTTIEVNFTLLN